MVVVLKMNMIRIFWALSIGLTWIDIKLYCPNQSKTHGKRGFWCELLMKTLEKILWRGDSTYQWDIIPSSFEIQDLHP